jgi:hypothetical protein
MRRIDRVFKEMEAPEVAAAARAAAAGGGKRRSRYVVDVWHKSGGSSGGTELPRGPAPLVRRLYGAIQRLQKQTVPVRHGAPPRRPALPPSAAHCRPSVPLCQVRPCLCICKGLS